MLDWSESVGCVEAVTPTECSVSFVRIHDVPKDVEHSPFGLQYHGMNDRRIMVFRCAWMRTEDWLAITYTRLIVAVRRKNGRRCCSKRVPRFR
jgi:hypothetical protein